MFPLFFPLVALILGILLSPCLDPRPVWLCLPAAALLGCVRPRCLLLAVFLLGAGLRSLEPLPPADFGSEAVRVVGRLRSAPEWRGLGVYLDVDVETVDARNIRGRARLTQFLDDPELQELFDALDLGSGDRLEIVVRMNRPATYRNPGVFDYRRYLERQRVYWTGTIRNPRLITVLERGWRGGDRIRRWIHHGLERRFDAGSPVHGFVTGIVLGKKHTLPAAVERQFMEGGIYHLMVVSGFHLAVVAAVAAAAGRFVLGSRRSRLLFMLSSALAYAWIIGPQTPVLRAALMTAIMAAGKGLDRGYAPLNAVACAAMALLIWDPVALEDGGFQLTFTAVAAILVGGLPAAQWAFQGLELRLKHFADASRDGRLPPAAADWRVWRRLWCERRGLPYAVVTAPWRLVLFAGQGLILSASVDIAFAWFMTESFHRLSPVSPLLNVPAGLIASIVTPLGLLLIFLPPGLAEAAAWIVAALTGVLFWALELALQLPYASVRAPSPPPWIWALYILAAGAALLAVQRRIRWLCGAGVGAAIGLQVLMAAGDFSPAPPRDVVITFLDVGQGDSALVEFPDGRRMLVDGGGVTAGRFLGLRDESTFSIGENVVSAYLWGRRIRRLDIVVLSHAHNDHMDGLFDVLTNFEVGELWLGPNPMIPAFRELIELAQTRQIPVRWAFAGLESEGVAVLHPPRPWRPRRAVENNDSVVLLVRSQQQTALLTGDVEMAISAPPSVDVFKVPHHGSRGVRLRTPARVKVISAGANNPFGHPHESWLPALRTDLMGAITVRMEGPRPQVETALTPHCRTCKLTLLFGGH